MKTKKANEIWVGNVKTVAALKHLDGIRFRLGAVALDIHGKKIDPTYMRPLFIYVDDYNKYDAVMMRRLKAV